VARVIARNQLYSSHYFQTALELSVCVRESDDPKQPGFYLIQALAGARGSIVRKAAVSRATSNLPKRLTTIKSTLEDKQ